MSNSLWLLLKHIRPEKKSTKHRATEIRRYRFEQLEPRMLLTAATVNWNDVRQTIDGFGASSAWAWGTWSTQTMDYLYSPVTGAGLTLLRSRVAPNVGTSENLIMEQAAAYGARVWSTPWTPPREWKTNHDTANGGSLDPAHYQDYANALADYAQDMTRQGIPLYALSIQNEPNWTADYESCRWTAQQFADFLPYIGQTFAARGITTKIMLPEQLNWDFSLASTIMANPTLAQYVGILAAHNYGETSTSWKPCTIANGRSVWETEISSFVETDLGSAIDTADDIHQAMCDGNANAYHYWWLNASGYAGLVDNGNATKRMWAMGQYSRFVRPGWVRIGESDDGGLDITAFKDPVSGKFALVVVNTSTTTDINETFTLNGVTVTSVLPYVTSSTQNISQGTVITLTGGTSFTSTIASQSIVTFYGVSSTAAPLQAPTNVMATPVQGYMTSRIGLSWSDNSSSETAYTVERSTNGVNWTVLTSALAANAISYTDTGRAENTLYYYRVKPTNGDATTYSAVVSTSTVLQAPSNVNGSRVSNGINLTWTINSSVSTGVAIDRSLDGLTWTNIPNLATRATSYSDVISGYNAGQIYYYRVRNTIGGNYSALAAWNTGLAAPTNFAVAGVTTSSVTVTWTSPLGASGAWIQQYNSGSWSTVSPSSLLATSGTYTVTGLSASTTYSFRMRASSDADAVYSSYTSSVNATTVTPSVNPVVWYKADESSGSTLADSSGNGKTATLTGSYGFTTGVSGNAVNLTGGNASLPTGIVSALGDFTIAAWIKPTSIDSWARVFDFGTGTSNYMFFTPKTSDTSLPRFAITTGSGEQTINSSVAISASTWTHIAITLSGNTATLYINGVVAGVNTSMTLRPSSLGSTSQNYIGKSQYSWDATFKGAVDDFRIYERALSVSEVTALANTPPTVATAAAASPSTVTDTTTALSVLGADNGGESNLKYTWSTIGTPPAAVNFSANGSNAAKNTTATFSKAGTYNFQVTIMDSGGLNVSSSVSVIVYSSIAGRNIFYNNSRYDGHIGYISGDPAINVYDDVAIATDKQALLPGNLAAFANYTSFSRGINGIMVDIAGLANPGSISPADFQFQVGNGSTWTAAPDPNNVLVRQGAGVGGSDRVTITWDDNVIQNQWLQVTVKADANTGLAAVDVFYFGNAIGESGDNPANAVVDYQDELGSRTHKSGIPIAPISSPYDYNRDGRINATDDIIARHNRTDGTGGNPLQLISAPVGSPLAAGEVLQPLSSLADDTTTQPELLSAEEEAEIPKMTLPSPVDSVVENHFKLFLSDSLQRPAEPITSETPHHSSISQFADFQSLRIELHQGLIGKSNLPDSTQHLLHDTVFSDRSNWGPFAQHRLPLHSTASKNIDVNFEGYLLEEISTPLENAVDAVWLNIKELENRPYWCRGPTRFR